MKKKSAPKAKATPKPASKKAAGKQNAEEVLSPESTEAPAEEIPVETSETETEVSVTKSKGRDNSTLSYKNLTFKKGPLVREVLKDHVAANKGITYKKLKEAFPDELLKRFGVFQDEETARSLSGARDRYAFQPDNLIKLKDKTIAVCNQWTLANIQPFLKAAKALGYKIK